ncbi:unnamed protein product [Boreogadus saida]
MILLVQFLWGRKWEVELTSCENVLTYFITKDAKLCKSLLFPLPLLLFLLHTLCLLSTPLYPPFHSILWLFGTSRCRWLDGVMDLTTLLPHVSIPHPLVLSHDVSVSTAEKGYKDGKWNGGRRRWEGGGKERKEGAGEKMTAEGKVRTKPFLRC